MKSGKFIVIEGTDGSGKATQVALLARHFRRLGKRVRTIAFPQYGQPSAGAVEAYLNGVYGSPAEVGTYQAAIFYAVDRAAARPKLMEWLRHGDIVIADRFIASNWAYGGALLKTASQRRKYWSWDAELEFGLFNIPRPDRTVILAVPARASQKLILKKNARAYLKTRKRDLHERDVRYQAQVLAAYREIANQDSAMRVVECENAGHLLSKKEVHERVLRELRGLI
jgi:dTMP kinase